MALPKPTSVLERSGHLKNHPEDRKKRTDEPKPTIPANVIPPNHLKASQKKAYQEIIKRLPEGVAFDCDEDTIALAAVLRDEFKRIGEGMATSRMVLYHNVLASLGMSPSSRTKVKTVAKKKNAFDDV